MKLFIILYITIFLLAPIALFPKNQLNNDSSLTKDKSTIEKVDLLNKKSQEYLRYDIPKAKLTATEALEISEKNHYLKGQADALSNLSNSISTQSSSKQLLSYNFKALEIYRKIGDKRSIAKSLIQLSSNYFSLQNYSNSYNYATSALKINEELSDKLGMGNTYLFIGRIYGIWNMDYNANEAYNYAKHLYKQINFYEGLGDIYILQGDILAHNGDLKTAKKYYDNSIYLYKKSGSIAKLGESFNVMSTYYSDYEKNLNRSFYCLNKAINISIITKDSSRLASFYTHKAHLYFLMGDYKQNLYYDNEALKLREKLKQILAVGSSYINLGSDYIYLKDFKNAEKYLLMGYKVAKETGIKYYARRAAHILHGLYRMENKPEKALLYLDSAYKITQIINEEEKKHQTSLVEAERKLRIKSQKISYLEDKRSSNFINMLWIIILLGLSTTILFFYLYRTKKIDNIKLREKSTELQRSEQKYRNLIETAPDFIYSLDSDGRFLSLNPSFEILTGYSIKDFLGKRFDPLCHPEDLELAYETFWNSKNGIPQEPYILRIKKKSGDYFYGEFISKELTDDGKIIGEFGIVRDITAKKIAEDALRASEERYRTFINSTDDFAFLKDSQLKYMIVNKSYADFFDKPEQFILGKSDYDLMPFNNAETCRKSDDIALNSTSVVINEEIVSGRVYDTHKFRVALGDGKFGVGGYIRDITEKKKAEAALISSEKQYSNLVETMNDGLMQVDNNDVILFVNKAICDMFGYTEQELLGKVGNETVIHPEDKNIVLSNNKNRLAGISERYEVRGVKKSGEVIWIRISGSPLIDSNNNTIGSVGLISDITEKKLAEQQMKEEKQFSDFLIESLPGIFYMFDANLKPLRWNKNKQTFLGLTPEQMAVHNILDSISAKDKEKLIKSIQKTLETGESQEIIRIIQYDGEEFSYHLTGKKLDTDKGPFLMGVGIDISDRVKIEKELIVAKEKAEESERLKSSFLANMSHELRTPMVGILGFSQLLSETEEIERIQEMAEIIHTSGKRLMDTLNMILDLARIESGESAVEISRINLVETINKVINIFEAFAKNKNLNLTLKTDFAKYEIFSSENFIENVLNNLINNAIKFTNEGSIKVFLDEEIIDKTHFVVLRVKDTGIGINKKDLGHIFQEFRQVSEGLDKSHEGTGLGLTLCKKYVELLGGSISVESEFGKGTTFEIKLPNLQDMTTDYADKSINNKLNSKNSIINKKNNFNLKVLVVDDDATSSYLVEKILGEQYFVESVNTAQEAIEKAKKNLYSIILMDINLGKSQNGIYATTEIRKLPAYKHIPIIAMTAYAMIGDREEFISKGCTDYISKPFTKEDLVNLILKYI